MNNENILKFIQEKRDEYKGALTERTEYTNTISEIDNVNKKEFINEYNNIKLLL